MINNRKGLYLCAGEMKLCFFYLYGDSMYLYNYNIYILSIHFPKGFSCFA